MTRRIRRWNELPVALPEVVPARTAANNAEIRRGPAPPIDYAAMERLLAIDGLRSNQHDTSVKAHDTFMAGVRSLIGTAELPSQARLKQARRTERAIQARKAQFGARPREGAGSAELEPAPGASSGIQAVARAKKAAYDRLLQGGGATAGSGPTVPAPAGETPRGKVSRLLCMPQILRGPHEVDFLAAWVANSAGARQLRFSCGAVTRAMMETCRGEVYPRGGAPVPGDFVEGLFALVVGGRVSAEAVDGTAVRLGHGDVFGAGRRPVRSVVATQPSLVVFFGREMCEQVEARVAAAELQRRADALSEVTALRHASRAARNHFLDALEWLQIAAGARVTDIGRPAPYLGFVVKGTLEARVPAPGKARRDRVVIGAVGPGGYFGERRGLAADAQEPEPFSLTAGAAGATILVLRPERRDRLDAALAARLATQRNPNGLDRVSDDRVLQLYMEQRTQAEWQKLRQVVKADARHTRLHGC